MRKQQTLLLKVQAWYAPFHAISDGGLPKPGKDRPWGKGRLDAVGMIINRVAGSRHRRARGQLHHPRQHRAG